MLYRSIKCVIQFQPAFSVRNGFGWYQTQKSRIASRSVLLSWFAPSLGKGINVFRAERIYSQSNPKTGMTEWFFSAREGNFGPFSSKEIATKELQAFISYCIKNGDDGGRKSGKKTSKLSLEPMYDFALKRRE